MIEIANNMNTGLQSLSALDNGKKFLPVNHAERNMKRVTSIENNLTACLVNRPSDCSKSGVISGETC